MNKPSHILIATLLYEYVKKQFGIDLEKESFITGNVLPDYRLSFLTRPHFIENNIFYVQKQIQRLLNTEHGPVSISKKHSKLLGIICHYYTDFFCFTHSRNFTGGLLSYLKYENDLYQYLLEHAIPIKVEELDDAPEAERRINTGFIYHAFDKLHAEYLHLSPSYDNDLAYSISACIQAIVLIAGASAVETTEEVPVGRWALNAV